MAGTQKNHNVNQKYTFSDTSPWSDQQKKSFSDAIDKMIADSKAKAKAELEKRKAPKTNWITKIGSK